MERESFTLHVNQEISFDLVWIVAGVLVVSGVFYLSAEQSTVNLWPLVVNTGIAAGIFLVLLALWVCRPPVGWLPRTVIVAVVVAYVKLASFQAAVTEQQALLRAEVLRNVRTTIVRGVSKVIVADSLMLCLEQYYKQPASHRSFVPIVGTMFGTTAEGANVHKPLWQYDHLNILLQTLRPDSVVLVATEQNVWGRDPRFLGVMAAPGVIQERYILTSKGVTHVSDN